MPHVSSASTKCAARSKPVWPADIIATEGNPLDNANALKKVVFVMKNGVPVRPEPR
jgi:hypothetical protein